MRSLERAYRGAWFVVAVMLLAAVAGWLISLLLPPRYEAAASITTSIDYSRVGILTDLEEDQTIVAIGDLVRSTEVIGAAKGNASQQSDIFQDVEYGRDLFLDRVGYRWTLRVTMADPRHAHELVNLWAEAAMERLNQALFHAENAEVLARQRDAIIDCLEQLPPANPAAPLCAGLSRAELQSNLAQLGQQLQAERELASGLYPAVLIILEPPAGIPDAPVRFARSDLIFTAAILGLVAALVFLETGTGDHIRKILSRDR